MIRLVVICLLFLAFTSAHGQGPSRESGQRECLADARECFELFNCCEPILVRINVSEGDVIGLSEDSVRRIVQDGLRGRGLIYDIYDLRDQNYDFVRPVLAVTISIVQHPPEFFPEEPIRYYYSVQFSKSLFDPVSGETRPAVVWERGASGADPERERLLQAMFNIQRLDVWPPIGPFETFINDYLRVNEVACE